MLKKCLTSEIMSKHMKDQFGVPKMWLLYLVGIAIVIIGIMLSTPSATNDPLIENEQVRELHGRELVYHQSVEASGDGVFVEDQSYGSAFVVVEAVTVEGEGYVEIYADDGGVPGEKIGRSQMLSGAYENVVVDVDSPLIINEVYYAVLVDTEGEMVTKGDETVVMMSFTTNE